MKQCVVFLGKTGSGKDTQVDLLAAKTNAAVLRTGDLVRARTKTDPELKKVVESGQLAAPELVDALAAEFFTQHSASELILCDGYPRLDDEEAKLQSLLEDNQRQLTAVILLDLDDSLVYERLQLRARSDDLPSSIAKKLAEFRANSMVIISDYEAQGVLIRIDASPTPEQIHQDIVAALNSKGLQI